MTQAIERANGVRYEPLTIGTERLGDIMVKSGFFSDTKDQAQAIVKILYGAEMGFGPVASMMGCYIVNGRPSASAQLIASAIIKSGRYRYRVRETTDTVGRADDPLARTRKPVVPGRTARFARSNQNRRMTVSARWFVAVIDTVTWTRRWAGWTS